MQDILARLHDEMPRASSDLGDEYRTYRQEIHAAFEANRVLAGSSAKKAVRRVNGAQHSGHYGYKHPDR